MRKFGLFLLVAVFVLSGLSAQATPVAEFVQLADYYPNDTTVFVGIRTDDGYVETLDAVLERANAYLPGLLPPGVSVDALLDAFAFDTFGADFEATLGNWLGDRAAIGFTLTEDVLVNGAVPPALLAAAITDREAATNFIQSFIEDEFSFVEYEIIEEDDYTAFISPLDSFGFSEGPSLAVFDDVLLGGILPSDLPLDGVDSPLSANESFTNTLDLLPEDAYNILTYLDTPTLQRLNLDLATQMDGTDLGAFGDLTTAVGSLALGATVLNGDTLTLDIAVSATDAPIMEELGLNDLLIPGPVDLGFAERIPADAPLVIHSADFGPTTQAGLDAFRALSDLLQQQGGFASFLTSGSLPPEAELLFSFVSLESLLVTANISFAGLTGLSLERDVLPVLDGDAAVYLRLVPLEFQSLPLPVLPDFGLIFQTSDAAGAQSLVDALFEASEAYESGYSISSYGDGAALTLPLISDLLGIDLPQSDLLFASAEDFFVFGTRTAVETTLDTDGGLAADATFQDATNYFLPGSQQVWYIATAPLIDNLDMLQDMLGPIFPPTFEVNPLALVEHSTLSAVTNEDRSSISRATITLGDMPDTANTMDAAATEEPAPILATPTALPTLVPAEPAVTEEAAN